MDDSGDLVGSGAGGDSAQYSQLLDQCEHFLPIDVWSHQLATRGLAGELYLKELCLKNRLDGVHLSYRPDIDGLRAIAVLLVVGYHAFPDWVKSGFIGVDIFFVISGFLISSIIFQSLENNRFSFYDFYARRIRRIFPALILVLSTCYALGWYLLWSKEYEQLGQHIAAGAFFVSNLVLWSDAGGYFDSSAITKPLLHLWSLGIEEQFYIGWPLLLGLMWKCRWNFLLVTIVIAIASLLVMFVTIRTDPVAAFYSPLSRFWELMVGSILAYFTLHKPHYLPKNHNALSSIGLFLIVVTLLYDNKAAIHSLVLLSTAGAFLLIAAQPTAWINRYLLSHRVLVWIGLISYPLYLWHWPLLSFAHLVHVGTPALEIRLACVVVSVILAWITYEFIEKNIRSGKNRIATPPVLLVSMTLVGFIGYQAYFYDGFNFRAANANLPEGYDAKIGYRLGVCFFDILGGQPSVTFSPICDGVTSNQKPLFFLWGDSHAAGLYPGLNHYAVKHQYDLAQFTASGCPPVLDLSTRVPPACEKINHHNLQKIQELKPTVVVMGGFWSRYFTTVEEEQIFFSKLSSTIEQLRKYNVRHIVLFGHFPVFTVNQYDLAVKLFKVSSRTYREFDERSSHYNKIVGQFAIRSGVAFVSPIDLLCNPDGCLLSTSEKKLTPLAFDAAHLTEDGSVLLIGEALAKKQFVLPQL